MVSAQVLKKIDTLKRLWVRGISTETHTPRGVSDPPLERKWR